MQRCNTHAVIGSIEVVHRKIRDNTTKLVMRLHPFTEFCGTVVTNARNCVDLFDKHPVGLVADEVRSRVIDRVARSATHSEQLRLRLVPVAEVGRRFLSVEKIVPTEDLLKNGTIHTMKINRSMVDGVIEAPNGAHFTNCQPDYERDEKFQKEYAEAAKDPDTWQAFVDTYLSGSEADYQKAVAAR